MTKAAQSISFAAPDSGKPGSSAALTATGGDSGNPVTFSVDSSSDAGACSLAGSTVSYLAEGNCVIDADQAGDGNYQAAPQVSQTIAVKTADLSVTTGSLPDATIGSAYSAKLAASGGTGSDTWSVTSGQLPPGLSLDASAGTISGTSAVAGTFAVTVQATDSSSPAQTATAQLSIQAGVGASGTTITGTHSGALMIGPGVTSIAGATITGPVTIKAGAVVSVTGSTIQGALTANGPASLAVCGTTVTGSVAISRATGPVLLGGSSATSACAADTFRGAVALSSNTGNVVLAGTKIGGATAVNGNTGGVLIADNTIGGPLACAANNPPPSDSGQPNTVGGPAADQCTSLVKNG